MMYAAMAKLDGTRRFALLVCEDEVEEGDADEDRGEGGGVVKTTVVATAVVVTAN